MVLPIIEAPPVEVTYETHIVTPGETFSEMADRWDVNIDDLMELNGFNYNNAYSLAVGTVLKIPSQRVIVPTDSANQAKFRMPVNGFGITVPFSSSHYGIDFGYLAEFGPNQPIFAAMNGIVLEATNSGGAGNYVKLQFDDYDENCTWYSYYKHLSAFSVIEGEIVSIGQQIGLMGTTGDSDGCHLHFDLVRVPLGVSYDNSNATQRAQYSVDPLDYLYVYSDQIVGEVTAAHYPLRYI